MKAERVRGEAPVDEVQDLTLRAFAGQEVLEPPSGALSESVERIAEDFAAGGGLLLRDDDGRLVGTCRVRRLGSAWLLRRCAVDPAYRRTGLGRRLLCARDRRRRCANPFVPQLVRSILAKRL